MKILLYSKRKSKAYITKITLEPDSDKVVLASIVFNNSVDKFWLLSSKKKMSRPFKQTLYNPIKMQTVHHLYLEHLCFFIKSRSTETKDIEV